MGAKVRDEGGKFTKSPVYIDERGIVFKLYGGYQGELRHYYKMTYDRTKKILTKYLNGERREKGDETLRVSLYLANAKFSNLHIFVMDFDAWDEESDFFKAAKAIADKVTRSQAGGYHMFYGINKEAATPLFDSINLLASKSAKSYVCKTGAVTSDGKNKVDMFCDAYHFIYEWEPWDNTADLTDKTQALFELIKGNFVLTRSMDGGGGTKTSKSGNRVAPLQRVSEQGLRERMNERQQLVLADLKTMSADCNRGPWFSIGLDIYHVFGAELGGLVFHWWSSSSSEKFNESGCAQTWENICERGPKTELRNMEWDTMLMVPAF